MNINFIQLHKKLFDSLPGKFKKHFCLVERKEWANQTAISLEGIDKFFNETECPWDTIILTIEIWHYPEIEKIIAEHPRLQDKNVFVVTVGYKNYKFGNKCWLLNWPWASFVQMKVNSKINSTARPSDLTYGFGCLNNVPRAHRLLLGYYLYCNNLLDKVIFTQNFSNSEVLPFMFDSLPNFENYKKLLPLSTIPTNNDFKLDMWGITHPAFTQTYCNIVTTSETERIPFERNQNVELMDEKTFKPFLSMQIPLILSGKGHLEYLKNIGFEIMDDLTPAGYDQMRTLEKINVIVDIVKKGRDYIEDFYFSHLREIQHNYELAISGTLEDKFVADIQQLINS